MKEIKVLSRSSFLAQIQTYLAIKKIKTIFKGSISIQYTESVGDTDTSSKSWEKHGFGVFTNSLSRQLHLNKADLVVHSFKDLPVKNSKKSKFICLNRDDPRDVLLVKKNQFANHLLQSPHPHLGEGFIFVIWLSFCQIKNLNRIVFVEISPLD